MARIAYECKECNYFFKLLKEDAYDLEPFVQCPECGSFDTDECYGHQEEADIQFPEDD